MNPRHIEAFVAVVRTGSTVAAAEALNTSQPSISRMLAALEASSGIGLFRRDAGRLKISREGQLFYDEVQRLYMGMSALEARAAEIRTLKGSELRIATILATSIDVVPALLADLHAEWPDLRTSMSARSHMQVVDSVATGRSDLGLCNAGRFPDSVAVRAAWDMACVCAMPADHPLCDRAVVTVDDLETHAFVSLGEFFNTTYAPDPDVAARLNAAASRWVNLSLGAVFSVVRSQAVAMVDPLTAGLARQLGLVVRPLAVRMRYPVSLIATRTAPLPYIVEDVIARLTAALDAVDVEDCGQARRS